MSSIQNIGEMQEALKESLKTHWKLFLFQGVVMVILGILAVAWPVVATVAIDIYVGWLFLISGIIGLVAMFSARDIPAFLWTLLTAALATAAGVLLLWKPVEGRGVPHDRTHRVLYRRGHFPDRWCFAYRDAMPGSWAWMVVSGICDLILAAVLVMSWPLSAAWALGLLAGINLITSGAAIVVTAIEARGIAEKFVRSPA